MAFRKGIDYKGLGPDAPNPDDIEAGHRGIAGSRMLEAHPKLADADNETLFEGLNGESITFGRDRPASRLSGYGSEHQSGRIDIVVGRVSAQRDAIDAGAASGASAVSDLRVDPSMEYDAARIYISQKADVDEYFSLTTGRVGMSKAKSAIGIKADAVRIVGREGIKLVTRTDALNSQGGVMERVRGIDLIAGNDDNDLQPLVKGNNLVEAIGALQSWVSKLDGIVDGILLEQMQLNAAIATHTHQGTLLAPIPIPIQTLMSVDLAAPAAKVAIALGIKGATSLKSHRMNLESTMGNYLRPSGRKYICSSHNNVN
tara:strand:- start:907 stop:1851 length:945 start_codon:yes stop_codon:yes gene_type:complete